MVSKKVLAAGLAGAGAVLLGAGAVHAASGAVSAVQPRNLVQVSGTPLTGRDWSLDLAKLQNLDVSLSQLLSTLLSTLPRDVTSRADRILGQLTDGTSPIVPAKSGQLPASLTALGNLRVAIMENELSPLAYTTTPLPASGTYTSASFSVSGFGRIVGSCFSDQPGTLEIQQSPDNTNWDVTSSFDYAGNTTLGYSVEVVCPHARLRYANGATAQTVFRLYSFGRRV